ncbi:hypothetical protein AB0F81_37895 [Actinoplanes sp. NPDC024001]|uniref:hypothetical protein n=1 Tax=Actinoplanes sp. NPDC024001 TaxID=3154598 RepID=UPI0033DBC415
MDDRWSVTEAGPGADETHVLAFDEILASDRADLVAEVAGVVAAWPGVTAVESADWDVLLITAPGVPVARLTAAVDRWWSRAIGERRPWMDAMDRAAETVAGLAPGHRRDGWELTRVRDAELTQVITLDQDLRRESVLIRAGLRLSLPEREDFTVAHEAIGFGDDAALGAIITGQVLPALEALPSVDALLDRFRRQRDESLLHAHVLASRGRLGEAREIYQRVFERCQPRQRPHVLRLVAEFGVPPLSTGTHPHLTVGEEAVLAAWQAGTAERISRLRELSGLRLGGTRRSLDQLWGRLRDSPELFRDALAGAAPALPASFYGAHTRHDIEAGRAPFDPWHRETVELLTAYLGRFVLGRARDARWDLAADGELGLAGHGLLSRVFALTRAAFAAPREPLHPRRLRRLANDTILRVRR